MKNKYNIGDKVWGVSESVQWLCFGVITSVNEDGWLLVNGYYFLESELYSNRDEALEAINKAMDEMERER